MPFLFAVQDCKNSSFKKRLAVKEFVVLQAGYTSRMNDGEELTERNGIQCD